MSSVIESRTDTLWFCSVLLVEIFGLSVALGGPWIEVSYFLLVVISQTIAGAYIWAHLRRHELRLPIPELLAMGFAIGSSSAAISQLIIRDLLGIRLMISPYAPIIGVAIWLVFRRSARLAVQITHTDSTTLLWLLFPAPLAMSYFVVELLPVFVIPLALFAWLTNSRRSRYWFKYSTTKHGFISIIAFLAILSAVGTKIGSMLRTFPSATTLIGNDELYDFAHARGFTRWGIQENINVVGETFSYYKLSHLWLGPIIDGLSQNAVLLTASLTPILLYQLIGAGLWGFVRILTNSDRIANLATITIFVQATLPEPYIIERRPLYLFSAIILIAVLVFNAKVWTRNLVFYVAVILGTFVLASTRVQYALVLSFGIILTEVFETYKRISSVTDLFKRLASISIGLFISFQLFFDVGNSHTASLQTPDLGHSTGTAVKALALRVCVPIFVVLILKLRLTKRHQVFGVMLSALLFQLFFPRYPAERYTIEIILLISVPFISMSLVEFLDRQWQLKIYVTSAVALLIGFASRLTYEIYKWRDPKSVSGIQRFAYVLSTDSNWEIVFTILPVSLLAIVIYNVTRKIYLPSQRIMAIAAFVAMNLLGVMFATHIRTLTSGLRYRTEMFGLESADTTTRWITSDDYIYALKYLIEKSDREEIFATNSHPYNVRYEEFGSTLILTSITGRRSVLEAPFFQTRMRPNSIWDRTNTLMRSSLVFPKEPNREAFVLLRNSNVKWFVVDLERTELRDWEPWATTRFINDKVAILELSSEVEG